jgi:hypothetical protein
MNPDTGDSQESLLQHIKTLENELSIAQQSNSTLLNEIASMKEGKQVQEIAKESKNPKSDGIVSIKVVNESGCQTDNFDKNVDETSQYATSIAESVTQNEEELEPTFPVQHVKDLEKKTLSVNDLERYQNSSFEDLVQDLSAAVKAKVDLLKDLSKANKETEKMKHQLSDKILKLERELESSQRELAKLQEELKEKETSKEKLKEEGERKIKLLEGQVSFQIFFFGKTQKKN